MSSTLATSAPLTVRANHHSLAEGYTVTLADPDAGGASVGLLVGADVGAFVGADVGAEVGADVGAFVGAEVGADVGAEVAGVVGAGVDGDEDV